MFMINARDSKFGAIAINRYVSLIASESQQKSSAEATWSIKSCEDHAHSLDNALVKVLTVAAY